MGKFSKDPINPLIGAAGVSAVPMAARVVNKVGLQANQQNFLLMHAMGPNVAGVLGSAVAAGFYWHWFNARSETSSPCKSGDDSAYHRNIHKAFVTLFDTPAISA